MHHEENLLQSVVDVGGGHAKAAEASATRNRRARRKPASPARLPGFFLPRDRFDHAPLGVYPPIGLSVRECGSNQRQASSGLRGGHQASHALHIEHDVVVVEVEGYTRVPVVEAEAELRETSD